jgi:hypothetical protein
MKTLRAVLFWICATACTLAGAQSATIQASPNPCTIPPGSSSCLVNITYQTSGVSQPGLFFGSTLVAFGTSNTYSPNWITTGGYSFQVRAAYNDPSSPVLAQIFVSGTYDLRPYFPVANNVYRHDFGRAHHRYTFFWATPDFQNIYNYYFSLAPRQGQVLIWQKVYASDSNNWENLNCTHTYGHLFIGSGSDRGVVEVGDWMNHDNDIPAIAGGVCPNDYSILGYRPGNTFSPGGGSTGLNWSGSDGLTPNAMNSDQTGHVFRAFASSGWAYTDSTYLEYSSPKLLQILPTWSPDYGRDANGAWVQRPPKTYTNVIRMVLYHGPTLPNQAQPSGCSTDPANPLSSLYYSRPPFATYALELYLDRQNGILQETLLYDLSKAPGSCASFPATSSPANLNAALSGYRWYIDK